MAVEADHAFWHALDKQDVAALMEFVSEAGVDAKVASDEHEQPIVVLCAQRGFTAGVLRLVEDSVDVTACSKGGFTALHRAASAAVVNALLDAGADIEAMDKDEKTPLHLASCEGRAEVLAALIARGAAVNTADWYGYTPLMTASMKGHKRIAQLLLAADADASVVCYSKTAERMTDDADMAAIIRAGADAARAALADEKEAEHDGDGGDGGGGDGDSEAEGRERADS